jgi:hypothetical protein
VAHGRQGQQTHASGGQDFGEEGVEHGDFTKNKKADYTLKSLHPVLLGPNLHRPAA